VDVACIEVCTLKVKVHYDTKLVTRNHHHAVKDLVDIT